jgi:ethylmalonyl-CoA/methylmalonyl-CoA decarboxylase
LLETHEQFVELLRRYDGLSSGCVTMQKKGRVYDIVLSNDAKRGAMDARMMLQLGEIVDGLTQRSHMEQLGGLVLRGSGASFCAGLDLDLAKSALDSPEKGILMSDYMTDLINRIRDSSYVSVCFINGPAIGGGVELITATDFRIMLDTPRVKLQSVHARIGASPGWGGGARLCQLVGRRKALQLLGASMPLDAPAALAAGLVDALVPPLSATSTTTSSSSSSSETDRDSFVSKAAMDFLEPWVNEKQYPKSVSGIKYLLAGGTESAEEMAIREQEVFYARWFGPDNKQALGLGEGEGDRDLKKVR